MLKAAAEAKAEGICQPILLGNWDYLHKLAGEENISLEGIEIINMRSDSETTAVIDMPPSLPRSANGKV